MHPVIIIPTYVGNKRKTPSYNVVATYDHVTPLTHQGELPRCLASLRNYNVTAPIILLVVSEGGVEQEASMKTREIAAAFQDDLDIIVIDSDIVSRFHARAEELGLTTIKEGISLIGYGAIRNLGIVVAATLGFTEIIYIDDDEVINSGDFMENALYGLGKLSKKGIPVLVKSGYYTDKAGKWKSHQSSAWYNRYWEQGELFNKWIVKAMSSPRLSRSNVLYGGLMAIHREAYRRVSFDPWIPRGEDLDYLLNIRMCGGSVWFDNHWSVQHLPPTERNEAQRFKQDIYRWIYEHRKLEFSKTQIDLLQIQPHTLDPYPGPFLENSISKRVFLTALFRTVGRSKDRHGYFKASQAARREAKAYAEMFCSKYFEFQLGWAQILATLEVDPVLKELFSGGYYFADPDEMMRGEMAGGGLVRGGMMQGGAYFDGAVGMQSVSEHLAPNGAAWDPYADGHDTPTPYARSAEHDRYGVGDMGTARSPQYLDRGAVQFAYDPRSSQNFPAGSPTAPDLFDFELDLEALGIETDEHE